MGTSSRAATCDFQSTFGKYSSRNEKHVDFTRTKSHRPETNIETRRGLSLMLVAGVREVA